MRRNEDGMTDDPISLAATRRATNQVRRTERHGGANLDNVEANLDYHVSEHDDVGTFPSRIRHDAGHEHRLGRQETQLVEKRNASQRRLTRSIGIPFISSATGIQQVL